MLDIQHSELDQQNVTSYKNYPVDKPFINTKWVRPSRTLSKAYPESNRDSKYINEINLRSYVNIL